MFWLVLTLFWISLITKLAFFQQQSAKKALRFTNKTPIMQYLSIILIMKNTGNKTIYSYFIDFVWQ
jgi:hypothetical protein